MTLPMWCKHINWRRLLIKAAVAFVGFIGFVIFMDQLVMPLYTKHGKEYELPDLTEMPVDSAVQVLRHQGFTPIILDSIYSSEYAPGVVVRQNPLPFSTVKKGRRVYLIVSIGEKPAIVPNLVGLTPQDARFRLRESGLDAGHIFYDFSRNYPKGVVYAQSIPPGDTLRRGRKVNFSVSLGPPPESQFVPDLVGKSLTAARKELQVLGLPLRQIRYQYRNDLVPQTVLWQSVKPGTPIPKADSLDLVVSTDQPPSSGSSPQNPQ